MSRNAPPTTTEFRQFSKLKKHSGTWLHQDYTPGEGNNFELHISRKKNVIKLLKDKLQRFQSRAARVLTGANYDIRSADIIQTLSWDTLDARRLRAKSKLMHKILNDDTAPNLRNSFVRRNVDQTDYHLKNSATDLTLPKPKREFLKSSFKYSGAMLWNQLPNEAKLPESIYSFNKCIKT